MTPAELIEGGAIRDNNLFHSFTEFNVTEATRVYFANPDGITNIFSRITGGNISEILGTLGVNGAANLFLLNPNGIIFGNNARLDVNGSFLATTGESFVFENGLSFSSSNPQAPPLLTINVPFGIQYGAATNPLQVQESTLETKPGARLSLLGGELILNNAVISAPGGRVNLGGLSEAGIIEFNLAGSVSFPTFITRSDLSLSGTEIDVTNNGSLVVNAGNLDISVGSKNFRRKQF